MLEAKNLVKVYKPKKGVPVYALNDVSLKLPDTGMVFLLGKSGSGKSTLLNILGGLDRYDEGDIIIKGVSSKEFQQKHFDSYRNTYIGFIFQEYNILEEFSIGANIGLALELQGKKATSEQINDILRQVDLEGMGNRKPNELSGGQKQRVAIARALVKNPQIIMADEPTGALDSKTGKQVFDTLKKLSKEKLVLIVSHDREFSEQYADRIIELSDGKIISDVEYLEHGEDLRQISGLTFKENEIEISDDYVLTEEDTAAINAYLQKKRAGHKIRMGVFAHGRQQQGAFTPTDESKISSHDGKSFKLIKSRLPMKNAFRMGANSLNHKKFRLVLTVLLSVIAFSLFGLADTMASYNKITSATQSIIDSHIQNATFTLGVRNTEIQDGKAEYYYYQNAAMNDEDIRYLTEKTGLTFYPVFDGTSGDAWNQGGVSLERYLQNYTSNSVYDARMYGFTAMSGESAQQAGLSLAPGGRMPEQDNEIVITQFLVDQFNQYGFQNTQTDEKIAAGNVTAQSILGKRITFENGIAAGETYTIVGILETNFDYDRYQAFLPKEDSGQNQQPGNELNLQDMLLSVELENTLHYGFHTLGYVTPNAISAMSKNAHQTHQQIGTYVNIPLYFTYETSGGDKVEPGMGGTIVFNSYYFSQVAKDEVLQTVGTVWLSGTPKTALGQNEYVISSNTLQSMLYEAKNVPLNDTAFDTAMQSRFGNRWTDSANQEKSLQERFFELESDAPLGISDITYIQTALADWLGLEDELRTEEALSQLYNDIQHYVSYTADGTCCLSEASAVLNMLIPMTPSYDNILNGDGQNLRFDLAIRILKNICEGELSSVLPKASIIGADHGYDVYHNLGTKYFTNDATIVGYFHTQYTDVVISSALLEQASQYGQSSWTWEVAPHASGIWGFAIAPMPTDAAAIEQLVSLNYTEGFDVDLKFSLQNQVMDTLGSFNDFIEVGASVFVYVGIGLAVFSALLLMNFISVSISHKRREIGILRAIGSRSADVFKIFFSEAFIIACINYVLSVAASLVAIGALNSWMRNEGINVTLLNFGVRQFILMFLISVAVAAVASFLPVYRIAMKRPIDAIQNR